MHESFHLLRRSANRQTFNPTTIKRRNFDCHIATAKQCGTHWIKYMLSLVLCDLYDLPPPAHNRDDAIVGHTKTPPIHSHIPQIAVTHSHPHYALRTPGIMKALSLPKFIVLVRDPRDILVSSYEKTRGEYLDVKAGIEGTTFSQYLRGDVRGRTRIEDIWGLMLFFNGWGPVLKAHPAHCLSITYEEMLADPQSLLERVCDFTGIDGADDAVIARAVENSSRAAMKAKPDPREAKAEKSVNVETRDFRKWYSEKDRAFVERVFKDHLKYDFDYRLDRW